MVLTVATAIDLREKRTEQDWVRHAAEPWLPKADTQYDFLDNGFVPHFGRPVVQNAAISMNGSNGEAALQHRAGQSKSGLGRSRQLTLSVPRSGMSA